MKPDDWLDLQIFKFPGLKIRFNRNDQGMVQNLDSDQRNLQTDIYRDLWLELWQLIVQQPRQLDSKSLLG